MAHVMHARGTSTAPEEEARPEIYIYLYIYIQREKGRARCRGASAGGYQDSSAPRGTSCQPGEEGSAMCRGDLVGAVLVEDVSEEVVCPEVLLDVLLCQHTRLTQ